MSDSPSPAPAAGSSKAAVPTDDSSVADTTGSSTPMFAKKSSPASGTPVQDNNAKPLPANESMEGGNGLEADEEIAASSEDGYSKHEDEDEDEDDEDMEDLPQEEVNAMLSNLTPNHPGSHDASQHTSNQQPPRLPKPLALGSMVPATSSGPPSLSMPPPPPAAVMSPSPHNDGTTTAAAAAGPLATAAGASPLNLPLGDKADVRTLIMAAIAVMKSRKARPDSKRISNWIHR